MTTLPKELSPERCHQLRQGGILRVLVNLRHEHTFEPQNKPEADFNIESFLMDFNRKAELRARLSQQIRTIVKHTAKNEDELKILGWLETLRKYIERLYNFTVGWKSMSEDPSILNECTDQLTKLSGEVKEVMIETLTSVKTICPSFEQFGGVFVIVDYLRAQTRFNTKCHQFEWGQIDSTQFFGVAKGSKLILRQAIAILCKLVVATDSSDDIRLFLGNSRSLHEIMVGIAEDAYEGGDLPIVQVYCGLIYRLYYSNNVIPATSHLKDCGVIKCLAKFGMNTKNPKTLYYVLQALESPLKHDRQIALEFVSIDGAVDILIDVLVASDEKNEDVENADWYEMQQTFSICLLGYTTGNVGPADQMNERLLAIFASREIVAILVRYLEQITSIHESSEAPGAVLALLRLILLRSEDQRRKFSEIANGKEVVKRYESSDDDFSARFSKEIGKMFE